MHGVYTRTTQLQIGTACIADRQTDRHPVPSLVKLKVTKISLSSHFPVTFRSLFIVSIKLAFG